MLSKLFGGKEEPEKEEGKEYAGPARMLFEIYQDGNVNIICAWKRPTSTGEAADLVENISRLVVLMSTGKLLPAIQTAIATVDPNDEVHVELSKLILKGIQMGFEGAGIMKLRKAGDEPLISPTKTFSVRGDG